ncbi:MAG: sensor histidine kinase [Akkermansiaceae bacterium]
MNLLLIIQILFLLAITLVPSRGNSAISLDQQSISQLEEKRDAMEAELKHLANFTLREEVGSNGYRSSQTKDANRSEWVEVDLGQEISIDEIVLVPTLARSATGIQSEGFPIAFRILAGTKDDKAGKVIASFSEQDQLSPRIAPLLVPCSGKVASWVRVEATRLSSRRYDGKYALQLSELLVFSGSKNYALRRPVRGPQPDRVPINSWKLSYLTDGAVPYLMNSTMGQKSVAYIRSTYIGENAYKTPSLTIDLNEVHDLSGISLHAIEQSDTVPHSISGDVGIPRHLQVEGATRADFSDAFLLLDARYKTLYDISPILSWNIVPARQCRYVRLTALEPYIFDDGIRKRARMGFAEIELFAEGRNVALGKTVVGNFKHAIKDSPLVALTDGRNFYGNILPIREWMDKLARREVLERELPLITAQLQQRYIKQQSTVRRLVWLTVLLGAGILFTILITRMSRMRQVGRMKERFAADLHDELGASLHAIGLLGSHAKDVLDSPEELGITVDEITALSKRASTTTRYFSALQTAEEVHEDLLSDLQRNARRLIANLEYTFTVEGGEFIQSLKARSRSDLFLFFKECLININRHADATAVEIQLKADPQQIHLRISDNGSGIQDSDEAKLPPSLARRAKLLRAEVSFAPADGGGTCITLILRPRRGLNTQSSK